MKYSDLFNLIRRDMAEFACKYAVVPNAVVINIDMLHILMGQCLNEIVMDKHKGEAVMTIMGMRVYETHDPKVCIKVMLE